MSFADVMEHAAHRAAIGAAVLLAGRLSSRGRGPCGRAWRRGRDGRGELPAPAALVRRSGPTGAGGPGKWQTSRAPSPDITTTSGARDRSKDSWLPWLVGARGGSCDVRDMTDTSET